MGSEKKYCAICAWRGGCQKRFSVSTDASGMFIVRIIPAICPLKIRISTRRLKKTAGLTKKIIVQLAVASSK